jgi:hypothetical protein
LKRIGIAMFSTRPVFRGAWHLATAGAIFSSADSFIIFLYPCKQNNILSTNPVL